MAQASFWQKQSVDLARRLADLKLERRVLRGLNGLFSTLRGSQRWLFGGLGLALLIVWDWKLLLATAIGMGAMLAVYMLQQGGWQAYRSQLERFLRSSQRPFAFAVGSGGFAALLTYAATSMWAESENRWLAVGAIFQGLGTILTLVLLGWQICDRREGNWEDRFERLLGELTDNDPLKRAIAVRQLAQRAAKGKLSASDRETVIEYIQVMLARESSALVRKAAIESLQRLDAVRQRQLNQQPLPMPLAFDRLSRKMGARSSQPR
ncbi:ATP synthase subunit I [Oscillatoria sp. FACHB-1406]|uniref:ATP synthase subunit I n=1 Tax=Oscillatoria sp. FACHB-1406 TaxID=2692846 RepID=UPI001689DC23|nr:ATP synthase subunit I [Oscillatoria sp. FACHB-1406]MBD2577423.1 ATP synthase subunit I [Oscillatoria sp. FACHB-1406]